MANIFESAFMTLKNGMTMYFADSKARGLIDKLKALVDTKYGPDNPPPSTEGGRIWYATCSTSAGTGAKTATTSTGDFVLQTGAMVRLKCTTANTALNPTLSIDGSTAKTIQPKSGTSGMAYRWRAQEVIDLVYDGSNFIMSLGPEADTSCDGITKLNSATNSTSTTEAATPSAVKAAYDVADAKVDRAGDTMTGNLFVAKAGNAYVQAENENTGVKLNLDTGSGQTHGIYTYGYYDGSSFHSDAKWMIYRDGSGDIIVNGRATDNVLKSGDTMTGPLTLASSSAYIKQKLKDTSNYASTIIFENATPSSFTYKPHIGFHNTGGNSSYPGMMALCPWGTNSSPWTRANTGLSITYDNMQFKGQVVRTGTVAVADGGTGATTAAAALTNLGAAPAPTVIVKNTTSTSTSAITAEYTVSGSGTVIVYAGIYSDTTSDYGTWQAEIYYDGTLIMGEGTRLTAANAQRYGASTSVPVEVTNGKKIKITLMSSKGGSKNIFRRFLCFGCTVS